MNLQPTEMANQWNMFSDMNSWNEYCIFLEMAGNNQGPNVQYGVLILEVGTSTNHTKTQNLKTRGRLLVFSQALAVKPKYTSPDIN